MDPILRRSSFFHISALVVFIGTLARRLLADQWPAFELIPLFAPIWLVCGLAYSEWGESYGFLRQLPVARGAIVRRKLGLILAAASGYWLFMMAAALWRRGDGAAEGATLVYVTLVCGAGLLLAACSQIGLWHYGRSFFPVLGGGAAVLLVAAVVHTASLKRVPGWPVLGEAGPVLWLGGAPWLSVTVVIGLSVAMLYGLARAGERVIAASEGLDR